MEQRTETGDERRQRAAAMKGQKVQLVAKVNGKQARQNELSEAQEKKEGKRAELTEQRDQQAKSHQETKQQAESLKAQNDKVNADSAQQQTENGQLLAKVSALQAKQNGLDEGHKNKDAQIVAVTEQRDKEAHWHQKNKNWAESLNKQCEELKVYSAERQKSADLALKLQTKAQVDLENLREKYQHKHINEQKLVALILSLILISKPTRLLSTS